MIHCLRFLRPQTLHNTLRGLCSDPCTCSLQAVGSTAVSMQAAAAVLRLDHAVQVSGELMYGDPSVLRPGGGGRCLHQRHAGPRLRSLQPGLLPLQRPVLVRPNVMQCRPKTSLSITATSLFQHSATRAVPVRHEALISGWRKLNLPCSVHHVLSMRRLFVVQAMSVSWKGISGGGCHCCHSCPDPDLPVRPARRR